MKWPKFENSAKVIGMNKDLERNLKLTPQQRIEEHQKALNLVLLLKGIKKQAVNARRSQPTS